MRRYAIRDVWGGVAGGFTLGTMLMSSADGIGTIEVVGLALGAFVISIAFVPDK